MTDPQNDVSCRDCKRPTQHATEICADCRTPAGRLVTALRGRGVRAETSDDTDGVIVNGLFVDAVDCGWGISGNGDDLDGNITSAASAIAAIVQAPGLRAENATLADVIAGEAANALREIGAIIGCPANADPLTDLDGLVLAVRGLVERAETVRVVTADRDALAARVLAEVER